MVEKQPFIEAGDAIAAHPFLQEAVAGTLPISKWQRYFSARLLTGPGFVGFLNTLEQHATRQGHHAIAAAARNNFEEEIGMYEGQPNVERAHATWRKWFREGMERIFQGHGMHLPDGPAEDFTEVHGYTHLFQSLGEEGDVLKSMGALGVLEHGLAREYELVIQGLGHLFSSDSLTAREWTYLRSHAHHDNRHFEEVYEPLSAAVSTPTEEERVMCGLELARKTKLAFLDGAYRQTA